MPSGSTVIANLALSHLAQGVTITDLDSDRSAQASAVRAFYQTALEDLLRSCAWPFATRIASLNLSAESPNDEWDYAYRLPTKCLCVRRVLSGTRNDTRDSRIPYRVAQDDAGLLLWTDQADAQVEYTVREDDSGRYHPDFKLALSYYLAFLIAPRLCGKDELKLGQRSYELYKAKLGEAIATAANEEQPDVEPESSFISGRE